jgi:hypothetical protein
MIDYRPAEFVRFVDPGEPLDALVEEAKADTWVHAREHAVLLLEDGRFVMVRGGRDGIQLTQRNDGSIYMDLHGAGTRIRKLAWHTHPEPTGPSDHDRALLDLLGQATSVVYEIRGEREGTLFRGFGGGKR